MRTACVPHERTESSDTGEFVERYRIGLSDVESRVERTKWLSNAADVLCITLNTDIPEFHEVRALLSL